MGSNEKETDLEAETEFLEVKTISDDNGKSLFIA